MAPSPKIKVLLVDDDASLLDTLAEQIQSALKVVVKTAASVPSAIVELDENGPFDIIVSDYQMPPHTAHDLTDHMKRAYDATPFIVHSGFSGVDESKFEGQNYLGLVPKPETKALIKLIGQRFPHAVKK